MPLYNPPSGGGAGATTLPGLTDVNDTLAPGSGDYLRHDGTDWKDSPIQESDIPAAIARDSEVTTAISNHEAAGDPHTGYQRESEKNAANGYAGLDASSKLTLSQMQEVMGIADLSNVTISSPSSGQVIKYNGTNWVNDTDATGGGGSNTLYAPGSVSVATGNFQVQVKNLQLTGAQRLTVAGTGRFVVRN